MIDNRGITALANRNLHKNENSTGAVLFAADSARGILTFKNVNIANHFSNVTNNNWNDAISKLILDAPKDVG